MHHAVLFAISISIFLFIIIINQKKFVGGEKKMRPLFMFMKREIEGCTSALQKRRTIKWCNGTLYGNSPPQYYQLGLIQSMVISGCYAHYVWMTDINWWLFRKTEWKKKKRQSLFFKTLSQFDTCMVVIWTGLFLIILVISSKELLPLDLLETGVEGRYSYKTLAKRNNDNSFWLMTWRNKLDQRTVWTSKWDLSKNELVFGALSIIFDCLNFILWLQWSPKANVIVYKLRGSRTTKEHLGQYFPKYILLRGNTGRYKCFLWKCPVYKMEVYYEIELINYDQIIEVRCSRRYSPMEPTSCLHSEASQLYPQHRVWRLGFVWRVLR